MHMDGQLRASHLILCVNPVYSIGQTFSQALLVDNPLLSYIDVWHAKFLPSSLTTGEVRDLGSRYTTTEDHAPVRDESAGRVSQNRKVHVPIEEPEAPAQPTQPKTIEVGLEVEMVTR